MRTKVGWAMSAVLGVVLLGAASSGPSDGLAQAGEGDSGQAPSRNAAAKIHPAAPEKILALPAPNHVSGNEIETSTAVKTTATPGAIEASDGACRPGMVEVEGDYCEHVEETCLRWLDPDEKMRCAEFAPGTRCEGKTTHKKFCVDAYEYPNQPGTNPVIMKTWYEAKNACTAEGKRLCGDSEWTLACEGQERMPYPYGYARNADACNIDKPHPDVDEAAIANPATRAAEVARLWQGEPSGTREACVSPYGVHDMTGNVDEWVVNEGAKPYKSGLKGGYWGPVRDRCRPMTTAHNEEFSFYQIGFRCCSDVQNAASPSAASKPSVPAVVPVGTAPGGINSGVSSAPVEGAGPMSSSLAGS